MKLGTETRKWLFRETMLGAVAAEADVKVGVAGVKAGEFHAKKLWNRNGRFTGFIFKKLVRGTPTGLYGSRSLPYARACSLLLKVV